MPRLSEAAYAQHYPCVVKLAKRKGGVSRPEIMEELSISRVMADTLIDRCKLRKSRRKVGRLEFFHTSRGTSAVLEGTNGKTDDADNPADNSAEKADAKPAKKASAEKSEKAPKVKKTKAPIKKKTRKPSGKTKTDANATDIEKLIEEMSSRAGRGLSEFLIYRAKAEQLGDELLAMMRKSTAPTGQ